MTVSSAFLALYQRVQRTPDENNVLSGYFALLYFEFFLIMGSINEQHSQEFISSIWLL